MRSSMTTVHDSCESSSSCHRRRTHRGLWLTGPDKPSRGRLVYVSIGNVMATACRSASNKLCRAFNCSLLLDVQLATSRMHCDTLAWSVLASDGGDQSWTTWYNGCPGTPFQRCRRSTNRMFLASMLSTICAICPKREGWTAWIRWEVTDWSSAELLLH